MTDQSHKQAGNCDTENLQIPCDLYPPPATHESCDELTVLAGRLSELSAALHRALDRDTPQPVLRHYPAALASIAHQLSRISDRIRFLDESR